MNVNAVVSGQAGVALLVNGMELSSIHAGRSGKIVRRSPAEARYLLGDAGDLQFLEDIEFDEVVRRLELASAQMDAFHTALILLDGSLPTETRQIAAEELQEFLEDETFSHFVESVLFAHPLTADSDLTGALAVCTEQTERTRRFLQQLASLQEIIAEVHLAWERIPTPVFGTEENRRSARSVAVKEGLFRDLVHRLAVHDSMDSFLLDALPKSKLRPSRSILLAWVAPLRDTRPTARVEQPYPLYESEAHFVAEDSSQSSTLRGREVFQQVERQKAAIVEEMKRRRFDRMERYVSDLIAFQLGAGDPVYACKSLCDLAMKAKGLGLEKLQLALTQRSVDLKPDDGWSWAQHGDALRNSGRLREALSAYDRAIAYDSSAESRNGRAEVLKSQNRLSEALSAYEGVIADFPENVVARTGRAEVLKSQNRLSEALSAYEGVIADFSEDVVARNGRAEVLKAQNRLDEALSAYEGVIADFPGDLVARNGRASVLVLMERWEEALQSLPAESPIKDQNWIGYHIRGMIYLRTGRIDDAIRIFQDGVELAPRSAYRQYFQTALAMAQIRQRAYEKVEKTLETVAEPALEAPANVLRFHAAGAQGHIERAREVWIRLQPVQERPGYREVVAELHGRYLGRSGAHRADEWLVQSEIKLLLAA